MFRPYEYEHIATDRLHLKREPRYRVYEVATGNTLATFDWAVSAKKDADRRNVEAGACDTCKGVGGVVTDYISSPDGDIPLGEDCPTCAGTGLKPSIHPVPR